MSRFRTRSSLLLTGLLAAAPLLAIPTSWQTDQEAARQALGRGELELAEKLLLRAVRRVSPPRMEHLGLLEDLFAVGALRASRGENQSAVRTLSRALVERRRLLPAGDRELESNYALLGTLLLHQGKAREALGFLERSAEILDRIHPEGHSDLEEALDQLRSAHAALGEETVVRLPAAAPEPGAAPPSQGPEGLAPTQPSPAGERSPAPGLSLPPDPGVVPVELAMVREAEAPPLLVETQRQLPERPRRRPLPPRLEERAREIDGVGRSLLDEPVPETLESAKGVEAPPPWLFGADSETPAPPEKIPEPVVEDPAPLETISEAVAESGNPFQDPELARAVAEIMAAVPEPPPGYLPEPLRAAAPSPLGDLGSAPPRRPTLPTVRTQGDPSSGRASLDPGEHAAPGTASHGEESTPFGARVARMTRRIEYRRQLRALRQEVDGLARWFESGRQRIQASVWAPGDLRRFEGETLERFDQIESLTLVARELRGMASGEGLEGVVEQVRRLEADLLALIGPCAHLSEELSERVSDGLG